MSSSSGVSSNIGKKAAAQAAAELIQSGMIVGLGTGSTAAFFLQALAARQQAENLDIRGVPTSRRAEEMANRLGIALVPLTPQTRPDLTIDGADEFDPHLNLIKGGGGALMQEKIVAVSSREMVVIADRSKAVPALGAFPLPVAVVPFGWETTLARLTDTFQVPAVRRNSQNSNEPFVTDDGLFILDLRFGTITDPADLQNRLRRIVGVAEVGLFVGVARRVLVGSDDGIVETISAG